ncbi:MAG: ferritin-like domain-containing protein [Bacteroidales bacterium]
MNICYANYLKYKHDKNNPTMINAFNSTDDILNFAINREQESIDLYERLSKEAPTPQMRDVFISFANEERGHKKRLLNIQSSGQFKMVETQIQDLKIEDYLVDVSETVGLTYQAALILAMKKEKTAFKLYMNLAAKVDDPLLKSLFETLAQEESKHKLRFELEYDEVVNKNN